VFDYVVRIFKILNSFDALADAVKRSYY